MTYRWAKCCECGGEVVFDEWATLGGEVHSSFDDSICTKCDAHDPKYTKEVDDAGTGSV